MALRKIVSGGQTGADRGALEAAIELGIQHGGACPAGRRAEDGRIPDRYQLIETASSAYAERTERNVLESDGTLLVTHGPPQGGSALTRTLCVRHRRPLLHADLALPGELAARAAAIREWLTAAQIQILNVAGPRESSCPGIAHEVRALLLCALGDDGGVHPPG